jgi:large subunit ribosomal protein L22
MPYIASHQHAPVPPRKARLVADLVRGCSVNEALTLLNFQPQRAAKLFLDVIRSAQANAEHAGVADLDGLFVKKIVVDQGMRLKRFRPKSRGSAAPIIRRRSHLSVELDLA